MSYVTVSSTKELLNHLREGRYTSLGSYPTYFVTRNGSVLSHAGVRQNLKEVLSDMRQGNKHGYVIAYCAVNYENPDLYCDLTNERIESAYCEPEAESADACADDCDCASQA